MFLRLSRSIRPTCTVIRVPVTNNNISVINNSKITLIRNRNLFSESFHGIDVMRELQEKKTVIGEFSGTLREVLRVKIKEKNMDARDLADFFLLTESEEDLYLCFTLLQRIVAKNVAGQKGWDEHSELFFLFFLQLCFILEMPQHAVTLWNDPILKFTKFHKESTVLSRLFMDLLFCNNMFSNVLETFKSDEDILRKNPDCVALTSLSCYKIGTQVALEEGLRILAHPELVIKSPRCHQSLALLAYNLNEYNVAFDLMNKYSFQKSCSEAMVSLMVMVLLEKSLVKEAVVLFEAQVGKPGKFCYFALDKLLDASKKSRDNSLVSRVQNLMRDLRSNHSSINDDLGKRLLQTIEQISNGPDENAPDIKPFSSKEPNKCVKCQ